MASRSVVPRSAPGPASRWTLGPVGIIPDGRYYVAGSHPDSLDSRYRLTGWVSRQQIVGKAHRVF
jgi:conjugal transfer pilin signal peptidase TrbI